MSHYFSKKQDNREDIKKIRIRVFDDDFEIYSSSGIFSKDELDVGSELLIENAIIENGWHMLDLGCGNGVIGVSLSRKYDINIIMSDINERAVKVAKMNIRLFSLKNASAIQSDAFAKIEKRDFDAILLNPPQTAGKELCFTLISKSKDPLKKGGILQIVARHNKGGASLEKHMESVFGNVRQIAKGSGFRVYISTKNV